jgi:hypothetical protein
LTLASGSCLVLIVLFLPETSRSMVRNGSVKASGIHRTLFSYLLALAFFRPKDEVDNLENGTSILVAEPQRKPFRFPNPLSSLKLLLAKDTFLVTLIFGVWYMTFSCLQASMSVLFIDIYKLSELNTGLVYLPFGVAAVIGAYCAGNICYSLPLPQPQIPTL